MLGNRRQEVERRLGAGDVHPLDDASFEDGAGQALLGHNRLRFLTVAGLEQRDEFLRLARTHLFEGHVEARIGRGHRDDVLNTRFESGRADRQVATARSTEPIDGIKIEVIKHCFGWLLPSVIQINALSQGAALPWTIERDDGFWNQIKITDTDYW